MKPPKSIHVILQEMRDNSSDVTSRQPTSFNYRTDESLVRLYESIRNQVEADRALGGRFRLVGKSAMEQAKKLQAEMTRRQLKFDPIVWP